MNVEVIRGNVISQGQKTVEEKETEYMTNPVPVNRERLSFGAVAAVQAVLALLTGGVLLWSMASDSEAGVIVGEIMRKIFNA